MNKNVIDRVTTIFHLIDGHYLVLGILIFDAWWLWLFLILRSSQSSQMCYCFCFAWEESPSPSSVIVTVLSDRWHTMYRALLSLLVQVISSQGNTYVESYLRQSVVVRFATEISGRLCWPPWRRCRICFPCSRHFPRAGHWGPQRAWTGASVRSGEASGGELPLLKVFSATPTSFPAHLLEAPTTMWDQV